MVCNRAATLIGACLLFIGAAQVTAAEMSGAPLTLRTAIERALDRRPELVAFQFRFRIEDARLSQAGLAPPVQLEALIEDAADTGERSGLQSAQASLVLSHVIELGGRAMPESAARSSARSPPS